MAKKKDFHLEWNEPISKLTADTFGQKAQLFAANEFKRVMEPYVPANNLMLSRNVAITADASGGKISYNSPYAHYQYEGQLYVDPKTGKGAFTDGTRFWSRPNVPKRPSGRKLTYQTFRHPLATDHWDKAAAQSHGQAIADAIAKYVLRGLK